MKQDDKKEKLADYIGKLDRLRWEYLRESAFYKEDWAEVSDTLGEEQAVIPIFADTEKGSVRTYFNDNATPNDARYMLWRRYGIYAAANPALTYEDVQELIQTQGLKLRHLFYCHIDEFALHKGEFRNLEYDGETPFQLMTVNVSLPTKMLVDLFREHVSQAKKQFERSYTSKLRTRRWALPKYMHLESLEEALGHYRMHVNEKMTYLKIAEKLNDEAQANGAGDDMTERFLSLVIYNIRKAKRTMRHVERGMFP